MPGSKDHGRTSAVAFRHASQCRGGRKKGRKRDSGKTGTLPPLLCKGKSLLPYLCPPRASASTEGDPIKDT